MDSKYFITGAEIRERLSEIDRPGIKVFGIPRGGVCAAAYLAHARLVDDPKEADFILDDIVDSGKTAAKWEQETGLTVFAVVDKQTRPADAQLGWIVFPWEAATDEHQPTDAVVRLLEMIGEDPNRAGLLETPARVVKAMTALTCGYQASEEAHLKRVFAMEEGDDSCPLYKGMVILRDIEVYSLCEHHMLPFVGRAHVAYIPNGNGVVGISKLARVVDVFARRLQVQERLTAQVAKAIEDHLQPLGVAVVIEAEHFCIRMRGVGKQNSVMVTSDLRGYFKDDPACRSEFFTLLGKETKL